MNEIGDAFAASLRRTLNQKKLTITAAAKQLGVSRQAFHRYLQGGLPRRYTLNKAVELWDLRLELGRYSFGKGAFASQLKTPPELQLKQPSLWDALDAVRDEDLQVAVKRLGKVLRVNVRIEIPA